ncbi:10194_t:CDS:2 [Funneliformis geosporum]|nr:10194_t:CDS:2 [Funneliformis geosporum]
MIQRSHVNEISESVAITSAYDSNSNDPNANESDSDANKSDSDVYFKSNDSDSDDEYDHELHERLTREEMTRIRS